MARCLTSTLAVCVGVLLPAVAGCGEGDEGGAQDAEGKTTQPEAESLLYVVHSESGSLAPAGEKDLYTLTLRSVGHHVTAFSDRPQRITFNEPTRRFSSQWNDVFGSDPPNAALDFVKQGKEQDAVVFELDDPRLRGSTLSFEARRLETADTGLAHYGERLDPAPPRRFADASLFIDYGAQDVYLTDYVYLDSEERDRESP